MDVFIKVTILANNISLTLSITEGWEFNERPARQLRDASLVAKGFVS